ncbi:hypothetical protein GJ700_02360 [Duganella sp. FT92W]|uniref:Uncharacterized protein n=1 Tax=Pseudoduganella rivuli TaxID=2666085 RepID=A0A7X2LQV9_9BURK|nr:hypothetical protein [Pseudoduganella rivuli]MRV70561.1 hypothetical protein [Pseudoduganella rivuli]
MKPVLTGVNAVNAVNGIDQIGSRDHALQRQIRSSTMDTHLRSSDVQYINYQMLIAIWASLQRDPLSTAYQFHLSGEQLSKLKTMSLETIERLVASMKNECLFTLRDNFLRLLDSPPALTVTLSAVSINDNPQGRQLPRDKHAIWSAP